MHCSVRFPMLNGPSPFDYTACRHSVMALLVSFIMSVVSESTRDVDTVLRYVYRLVPGFCLGEGLLNLATKVTMTLP